MAPLATADELVGTLRTASSHAPELARKVDATIDESNRLIEALQRNFVIRSTMQDRASLHTESQVRPPLVSARAGDPAVPPKGDDRGKSAQADAGAP